jgi:cysteinyl-tRNA synthetase
MQIYNTLSSRLEPFEPAEPGHARIYVCGPTVYDNSHLGHARCYVVYDVLVRHLRSTKLRVTYARNVTDIDDKIVKRAQENKEDPSALAERFYHAYDEDMQRLGNLKPDLEPKVSDHLPDIITLIEQLIANGSAYVAGSATENRDVYFHVPSCNGYGKLSHRKQEDMLAGASGRLDDSEAQQKKHPSDFALWKSADVGDPSWPSPWGNGRPGWHIECSAMSMKYLGASFDLHGGGLDLIFPHHENEIAQSECATGKPFARYWMHNGFVQVNKEKMSKSLGNFFTAREAFRLVEPEAIRYSLLTTHYRAPYNLEWESSESSNVVGFPHFAEAEGRLEYLYRAIDRFRKIPAGRIAANAQAAPAELTEFSTRLAAALDDDLNTPQALAHTAEFLRAFNDLCDRAHAKGGSTSAAAVDAAKAGLSTLASVLGLGSDDPQAFLARVRDRRAAARGIEPAVVAAQIVARNDARKAKDFARSDQIRDDLLKQGVEILDSPEGTTWRLGSTGAA